MDILAHRTGEVLAVSAALIWGFGVTAFTAASRRSDPFAVSFARLPLGMLLLGIAFFVLNGRAWPAGIGAGSHFWLGLSGTLGLTIGDTALFYASTHIGPRRATLMLTTAPVFTTVTAWIMLDEKLGLLALVGIGVIIAGVVLAVTGRDSGGGPFRSLPAPVLRRGLAAGLLCGLGTGLGNTCAKIGMGPMDPLAATYVRMAWAALSMGVILLFNPRLRSAVPLLFARKVAGPLAAGVVLGPFVGMWFAISSLKLTDAGVATVLLNTTPLTVLLPSWLFYRDPPTARSLLGVMVAIGGGILLFIR